VAFHDTVTVLGPDLIDTSELAQAGGCETEKVVTFGASGAGVVSDFGDVVAGAAAFVVGAAVGGAALVGAAEVGAGVMAGAVVAGLAVVGATVVGACVVTAVLGDVVVLVATVVATGAVVAIAVVGFELDEQPAPATSTDVTTNVRTNLIIRRYADHTNCVVYARRSEHSPLNAEAAAPTLLQSRQEHNRARIASMRARL
jgi:hypothetical protein